jgi:hypothetical protein
MMVLKRVGVWSAGKMMGAFGICAGLFVGIFFAVASLFGAAAGGAGAENADIPAAFLGLGGLIFFPILYGLICFVAGLFYAGVYNIVAGMAGGLELHLEPAAPQY